MSLSFLNPALAWGLAAAALPLLVHLFFRRRPRPVPFPAIDFILRARQETRRRLRLRRVLLFVARTALLAAAALAIARPRLVAPEGAAAAGPAGPAATAIVLDASASMRYRVGGRTLFEVARQDALEALAGLGADEPATVLVCGGPGVPAAEPPGFDKAELRRRLQEAAAGYGHADLASCTGAAVRALGESAAGQALRRRLVVATDLTASAWRLDAPAPVVATPAGPVRPEVALLDAARGAELPNAWLSGLVAEPDAAVGARGYRVTATVSGLGPEPVKDAPLTLRVGTGKDARVAVRAFAEIPAAGSARKSLAHDFAAGGPAVLTASLPGDALPEDDVLALTVEVPREVKVLVVDGAPSPVRPTVVDADGLAKAALDGYDAVFLLNVRSVGAQAAGLARFVERGGGLFVAVGDEVDPDRYDAELKGLLPAPLHVVKTAAERGAPGAAARAARFTEVDWGHPALAVFTGAAREGIESVRTFRYVLLRPERKDGGARVIVRFDDGAPALVEARRGRGRVVLFTSTVDREWSDWAIRTSFLPVVQRLAAYLGGTLDDRRDWPTPVHAPRILPVPDTGAEGRVGRGEAVAGAARVAALVAPDGRERRVAGPEPGGGPLTVTPDIPGLWQVKVSANGTERLDPSLAFAVWPDLRESDTRRLQPSELTAWFGGETHARVASDKPGGEGRQVPLWSWLLVLALAAFLAEGWLVS